VVIAGTPYWRHGGLYYRPAPNGYIIVEQPIEVVSETPEVEPESASTDGTYTVYVPRKTGEGFVSVTLEKHDGGYIGPQGEFYPEMPSTELLSEMYGGQQE
jgi:hypothetical protein